RFHFITEMVPVDFEKRKIKRISDVCFPKDAEVNGASDLEFSNLKVGIVFEESDKVAEVVVSYVDTDVSKHNNNVSYIRYILNTFDEKFYGKSRINELEIHYEKESHEGDALSIYRKLIDGKYYFCIKNGQEETNRAYVTFIDR
nr:hypothetical protein [Bacilli bacterium]